MIKASTPKTIIKKNSVAPASNVFSMLLLFWEPQASIKPKNLRVVGYEVDRVRIATNRCDLAAEQIRMHINVEKPSESLSLNRQK